MYKVNYDVILKRVTRYGITLYTDLPLSKIEDTINEKCKGTYDYFEKCSITSIEKIDGHIIKNEEML